MRHFVSSMGLTSLLMLPVHTGASQTLCDRHANDGGGDGLDLSPRGTRHGANFRIAYALPVTTLRIYLEARA
ncbi:hypothetical protein EV363DRAFT_77628 [Boletus edulis]|nr:hypothetical protein EV363DRAFT_77628 [Boletus edulis]